MVARWLLQLQTRHLHRLWTSGKVEESFCQHAYLGLFCSHWLPCPSLVQLLWQKVVLWLAKAWVKCFLTSGVEPLQGHVGWEWEEARSHTIISRRTHGYQTPEQHMSCPRTPPMPSSKSFLHQIFTLHQSVVPQAYRLLPLVPMRKDGALTSTDIQPNLQVRWTPNPCKKTTHTRANRLSLWYVSSTS